MREQTQLALADAVDWLGDWHPLAQQLGSADGLVTLGSVSALLELPPVCDVSSLRMLLNRYHTRILLPVELPAIQTAYGHAMRHELRELVALDQRLLREPLLRHFAAPSRRVGQGQLQRLRPLRDERLVRRYLAEVDSEAAHGWHTLVYGVTVAVYSLPLRQGLLGYGHQTTRGFIYSGARMLRLSEHECRELFDEQCADLPAAIDAQLRAGADN